MKTISLSIFLLSIISVYAQQSFIKDGVKYVSNDDSSLPVRNFWPVKEVKNKPFVGAIFISSADGKSTIYQKSTHFDFRKRTIIQTAGEDFRTKNIPVIGFKGLGILSVKGTGLNISVIDDNNDTVYRCVNYKNPLIDLNSFLGKYTYNINGHPGTIQVWYQQDYRREQDSLIRIGKVKVYNFRH